MNKLILVLAVSASLATACAAASERKIPTNDTPIVLKFNTPPIDVRADQLHRYSCEQGHLVVTNENSGAARVSTRIATLRCIP